MDLPFTIKTIEELPEAVREAAKAFYVEDKEVGLRLSVTGIEDPAELRRAKTRETEARKAAEQQLKELLDGQKSKDEAARKALEEAARKAGDTAALDKSWSEKYDKGLSELKEQYEGRVQSQDQDLRHLLIDQKARGIAVEIAVPECVDLIAEQISKRLRVEERDGRRITVVLDAEGKPSAAKLEDLQKEFAGNSKLARLMRGTQASGGGAGGGKGGGAPRDGVKELTRSDFDALDAAGKSKFSREGGRING